MKTATLNTEIEVTLESEPLPGKKKKSQVWEVDSKKGMKHKHSVLDLLQQGHALYPLYAIFYVNVGGSRGGHV